MKKAFTLVELLVVVVVLVTLMSVVFRLGSVGRDATRRNKTINRLQRIENCLSGYFAAFGSYPPVAVHGSRDFRYRVSNHVQLVGDEGSSGERDENVFEWERIEAACRSQPFAFEFPFKASQVAYVNGLARELQQLAQSKDSRYKKYRDSQTLQRGFVAFEPTLLTKRDQTRWCDAPVFTFGVMSYLLPRFLVALGSQDSELSRFCDQFYLWGVANTLPSNFETGVPYTSWQTVNNDTYRKRWQTALLPSQSVCARWLPNLEECLTGGVDMKRTFYGIQLVEQDDENHANVDVYNPNPRVYTVNPQAGGDSSPYALDMLTCKDGWDNDFYYYSAPPYQSYRVWSSGPNGKTFPPWLTEEEFKELKDDERTKARNWMADDIIQMSN